MRTAETTAGGRRIYEFGRSGYGIRWYPQYKLPPPRCARVVGVAGSMGLEGQGRPNHYPGTQSLIKFVIGEVGARISSEGTKELFLKVENQAVVHITNMFVSESRQMMRELMMMNMVLD